MPKKINYPRTNLKKTLKFVFKISELESVFTPEDIARHLDIKINGVLTTTISSALKYGLLNLVSNGLTRSELLVSLTNNTHQHNLVLKAFLTPQAYIKIYHRFNGKQIHKNTLEQIFVKEFDCEAKYASRAVKYFIEGLQFLNLLSKHNHLHLLDLENIEHNVLDFNSNTIIQTRADNSTHNSKPKKNNPSKIPSAQLLSLNPEYTSNTYSCQITGPDISIELQLKSEQDISFLQESLKIVRQRMRYQESI